jgi:hypothetical protein
LAGGKGEGGGGSAVTHQDFQIYKLQDVASPMIRVGHNCIDE